MEYKHFPNFVSQTLNSSLYIQICCYCWCWPNRNVTKPMKTKAITFFFVIKPTDAPISQIYFVMKLYMFWTVRLSIISSLFTVRSALVYVIQVCRQLSSRTRMELQFHSGPARQLSTNLYDIYHR
jgi:hypothetical protein